MGIIRIISERGLFDEIIILYLTFLCNELVLTWTRRNKILYGGRQLYQYCEDDFLFKF